VRRYPSRQDQRENRFRETEVQRDGSCGRLDVMGTTAVRPGRLAITRVCWSNVSRVVACCAKPTAIRLPRRRPLRQTDQRTTLKLAEPHRCFRLRCRAFQSLRRVIEYSRNSLRKVGLRHYPERVRLIAHLISLSGREHHGYATFR